MTMPPLPPTPPRLILSTLPRLIFTPSSTITIFFFPFLPPFYIPPPLCFPPQFGIFPYPYPPLPSLPSPSPPLQGSNHVLPKLPNLAPTPSAIPDIPAIETSQNIPSIPQSSDHGRSKRSFHINAKLFSFPFDGGWFDLYAIHETRWNVKSSI